ncbi:hypothetical protein DERP_000764 [Dermatophagoides pteronyssinus]|uniref:Transmembrane protein 198 n=1 Tax=Dermatophagoides pteronyssinus TaxID=6956 RepID=A0ABQ8J1M6_DERPT|nr:hypothetical protein DERP_000764 [Dermatophagoides pteronyssinus]
MAKSTLFLNSSIQNLIQSTTTTTNQSQQPYHQQQQKSLNSSFTILNNNENNNQNSHQNNNNLLHSQSSSIDNISLTPFLTSTTTTTIASNLTEDYQRPIFFQTSSTTMTDIFVDNIQPDDTNNIFSFAPGGRQCFHSPEDYELITSMLCSSLLVLGVVYFTYGYRCFRAFSFFVGFILGAILFHTICTAENISIVPTLIPQHGNLIASLLAGLMIGLFTMLVAYLGLFIIGIHLGLMLAIGLLIVIYLLRSYYIPLQAPLSSLTLLVFFISLSLVGSLTTVYFSKGGTIMASSMYGSALTLLCIDYFLEDFKVIHWFLDQLSSNSNNFVGSSTTNDIINNNGYNIIGTNPTNDWYGLLSGIKRSQSLCFGSFIILLLWPIFTLIGIIIQCCCTARHYKYHNGYGMVDNTSNGRCTPSILNHSRESIRSLNHYHYPYPNVSAKLYHHSTNSVRSNNDRSIKNSINMNATNLDEQRLEQRHRKYRYLYQVRTAHGDVISQHYLQSLQNKKQNHQQQQQQHQTQQQQQLCLPDQDSFTFNSDQSSHFFPSESRTTTLSVA